jgi:4-hydroxy-tetrahydrodipicolinate synthase
LRFYGSIPALVTPFQPGGALDLQAFDALVRWQVASGSSAVVVGGSTGESGALEEWELAELLACAVAAADGRIPVIAGVGAPATHKSIRLAQLARDVGANAVLAVTPPYARPTQRGLVAHYQALAAEGGLPVILYNVPARTGVDLLPETVAQLASVPGIVGIKEAVTAPERMQALLALKRADFAVLSGDDPTALRALLAGADGIISVTANVLPGLVAELFQRVRAAESAAAATIDAMLAPVHAALALEPNPIPVKAALALAARIHEVLRLPLQPLEASLRERLQAVLATLDGVRVAAASGHC